MSGYVPTKTDISIIKKVLDEGLVNPDQEFSLTHFASVIYAKARIDTLDQVKSEIDFYYEDTMSKSDAMNIIDKLKETDPKNE